MRRRCCGDALAGSAMLFSSMSASSFSAGSFFRRWLGQGGPYIQPIPFPGMTLLAASPSSRNAHSAGPEAHEFQTRGVAGLAPESPATR